MTERKQFKDSARQLTQAMEKELDEKRYRHTLSVAHTAASLAMCHGLDPYKAYLAGLLHDCAKCISHDKKLSLCAKYGLSVNDAEEANPDLLHAKLGSYLARDKYGIEDAEILSAILYHTTGKTAMSVFEQIIYIADYIEIYRKPLPNMEKARKLAFQDLDSCMVVILESTLTFLEEKGAKIDSTTRETYEYYQNICSNRCK